MAAALLTSGCGKFVRDELITMQNEMDQLYDQIKQMNDGLSTLRAVVTQMANNGYIVDVQQFELDGRGGYTLWFRSVQLGPDGSYVSDDSYSIDLYSGIDGKDGKDADPFVLSAMQDEDGRWYWYDVQADDWMYALDGSRFLVDGKDGENGEDGKTPKLDIEDGYWIISWDNGETWEETGWKARGDNAQEIFTGAEIFDDHIDLTLAADSTVISLARFMPLEVELTVDGAPVEGSLAIAPGDTVSIAYAITGTTAANAMLVAGTDGRFKTAIHRTSATEGVVDVICPEVFPEGGYIYITVNDGGGRSTVLVVNFTNGGSAGTDEGQGSGEGEGSGEGQGSGEGSGSGEGGKEGE